MGRYDLTMGMQKKALRVVLYGPEGIGKTTLAAEFPGSVFMDVEGGSDQLPVARLPRATSWAMLMDEVRAVRDGEVPCSTLVIDTADAAERLCTEDICSRNSFDSIESPGYGKGYTYVAESFGKLLDLLSEVVDKGTNVVMVAHAIMRKFERPDESGAYDRFEMKLSKKAAPMVKEWADMVLFLDYDITVVTNKAGKAKATGGKRVIRTNHTPQWDAKNRFGLADELPLSWDSIKDVVPDMHASVTEHPEETQKAPAKAMAKTTSRAHKATRKPAKDPVEQDTVPPSLVSTGYPGRLKPLADLMAADEVTDAELRHLVGQRGDFTGSCKVEDYPDDFIGFITSHWPSFMKKLKAARFAEEAAKVEVPFSETEPTAK